jgi:hypothetical protein
MPNKSDIVLEVGLKLCSINKYIASFTRVLSSTPIANTCRMYRQKYNSYQLYNRTKFYTVIPVIKSLEVSEGIEKPCVLFLSQKNSVRKLSVI